MEFKNLSKEDRLAEVASSYKKNDEQWIEALKKDGDARIGGMVLWGATNLLL